MNIVERFFYLMEHEEYEQALPVIQKMVRGAPHIANGWYNLGECLEKLEMYEHAATAFLGVVKIEPDDIGAYLRASYALLLVDDYDRLLPVVRQLCTRHPKMLGELMGDNDFKPAFQRPEFQHLAQELKTRSVG